MADSSVVIDGKMSNKGIIKAVHQAAQEIKSLGDSWDDAVKQSKQLDRYIERLSAKLSELPEKTDGITLESLKQSAENANISLEQMIASSELVGESLQRVQLEFDLDQAVKESLQLTEQIERIPEVMREVEALGFANYKNTAHEAAIKTDAFKERLRELNAELAQEQDPASLIALKNEISSTEVAYKNFTESLSKPVADIMRVEEITKQISELQAQLETEPIKIDIEVERERLESELADVHGRLEELKDVPILKRINLEYMEEFNAAHAEINALEAELQRLETGEYDVPVDVNTEDAQAQIEALRAELQALQDAPATAGLNQLNSATQELGSSMDGVRVPTRMVGSQLGMMAGGAGNLRGAIQGLSGSILMMGKGMKVAEKKAIAMWAAVTLGVSLAITGITKVVQLFSGFGDKMSDFATQLGEMFRSVGRSIAEMTRNVLDFSFSLMRSMQNIRFFNFRIRDMATGLGNAVSGLSRLAQSTHVFRLLQGAVNDALGAFRNWISANEQLNSMMNQIRGNILTGLAPAFEALMPILIRLLQIVNMLAQAFAQLMSIIFGTTFAGASASARALNDMAGGFGSAGRAAREMGRLLPIDEMNQIADAASGGGGGGGGGGSPFEFMPLDLPEWMLNLLDWLTDTFMPVLRAIEKAWNALLDSLKLAWDRWGDDIIQSWKRAVETIAEALEMIFLDLAAVFSGDEWASFLDEVARSIILIGRLIDSLGRSFINAWREGESGLRWLNSFVTLWRTLLGLVNDIVDSFIVAWEEGGRGDRIFGYLLSTWTNINLGIANFIQRIRDAWNYGGRGERIWGIILDIIESIARYANRASKEFRMWAKQVDFDPLLTSFEGLVTALGELVDALLPIFLDLFRQLLGVTGNFIESGLPGYIDIITDNLRWMTDQLEDVNNVFDLVALGARTFIRTITDLVSSILDDIPFAQLGSDFGIALNSIFADTEMWSNIGAAVGTLAKGIFEFIAEAFYEFDPWAVADALLAAIDAALDQVTPEQISSTINMVVRRLLAFFQRILESESLARIMEFAAAIVEGIDFNQVLDLITSMGAFKDIPNQIFSKFTTGIRDAFIRRFVELTGAFSSPIIAAISSIVGLFTQGGRDTIGGFFQGLLERISGIGAWLKENIVDPFVQSFKNLFGIASPSTVMAEIGGFLIDGLWNGILDVFGSVGEFFGRLFEGLVDWFTGIFGDAWEGVKGVWDGVAGWFGGVWDGITGVFSNVGSWFSNTFSDAKDGIANVWSVIGSWASDRWSDIQNAFSNTTQWFSTTFTNARNNAQNAFNTVRSFFSNRWSDIQGAFATTTSWFSTTFTNAREGAQNAFNTVQSFFSNRWSDIRGAFSDVGSWFSSTFQNARTGLQNTWDGISSWASDRWSDIRGAFAGAGDYFSGIGRSIRDGIVNGIGNLREAGANAMNGLRDGINSAASGAANAARNAANAVTSVVNNAFSNRSPSRVFRYIGTMLMQGLEIGILRSEGDVLSTMTDTSKDVIDTFYDGLISTEDMILSFFDDLADKISDKFANISLEPDLSRLKMPDVGSLSHSIIPQSVIKLLVHKGETMSSSDLHTTEYRYLKEMYEEQQLTNVRLLDILSAVLDLPKDKDIYLDGRLVTDEVERRLRSNMRRGDRGIIPL